MKFTKKILANGLTVLHEQRDVPVTTVMLGTRFGAINEKENEKGIAHFIEHLCFKGTEKRTTLQIAAELERVGGNLNAFTSEEETAYHVKLPSEHLELAMDVIFDIFFHPKFPQEEIKKEAGVICEEIKMYYDNPRAHAMDKIKECLYEKPFGTSIAGSEKSVKSMTRKQLLDKHTENYNTKNTILAVVGNNSFEDVLKLAEKFSAKGKLEGKQKEKVKLKLKNKKDGEKRTDIQQATIVLGFHFPTMSQKERAAAEILSTILGDGMSSKLFTEVREKRGLAYAVKSDIDAGKDYGYLYIYIGTDKGKVKQVIDLCILEFKKLKDLTEKELQEAKTQLKGNFDVESEDCAKTAVSLLLEEISGDAKDYYKYKEEIGAVSLVDVKKLVNFSDFSSYVVEPND